MIFICEFCEFAQTEFLSRKSAKNVFIVEEAEILTEPLFKVALFVFNCQKRAAIVLEVHQKPLHYAASAIAAAAPCVSAQVAVELSASLLLRCR